MNRINTTKIIDKNGQNGRRFLSNEPMDLWELLHYTKFAISRLRDLELGKLGVTPEQAAILQILVNRQGKASIAEISDAWMRQPHTVLGLVNRMEKQGLVAKTRYPKQREYEITITEKGSNLHNLLPQDSLEMVFSALSEEDQQKLSQYLKLLLIRSQSLLDTNNELPFLL